MSNKGVRKKSSKGEDRMKICVYGAASNEIARAYISAGNELGEELARRGHELVFGAGLHGMMGAVAKGVKDEGGKITGIIPTFFKEDEIEAIHDKCDELIFTETMAERKTTMEDMADAFIMVPGGIGTLEEFFQVITLKQLARHTKPVAIFDVNNYYSGLQEFIDMAAKERFVREKCKQLYFYSDSVNAVLDYIENYESYEYSVKEFKNG